MALYVTMQNPRTGEIKQVKCGWSWTLFLFSGLFGLPLFLRRLYVWGGVFLALWIVNIIVPAILAPDQSAAFVIAMGIICSGLAIWMGVKGNEMTAKNYLDNGWVFTEPQSDVTKLAKGRWGITV